MRKYFILALLAISMGANAQTLTRNGNQFEISKPTIREASERDLTILTIKDTDGQVYPLYISPKGRCYILRISKKSGKEYRKYLTEEQSRQICEEVGIEYVEDEKKNKE